MAPVSFLALPVINAVIIDLVLAFLFAYLVGYSLSHHPQICPLN